MLTGPSALWIDSDANDDDEGAGLSVGRLGGSQSTPVGYRSTGRTPQPVTHHAPIARPFVVVGDRGRKRWAATHPPTQP